MIGYRYDAARARYLDRMLDEQQAQLGNVVEVLSTWTDYDGNNTYSDFTFSVTENKLIDCDRYELGIAHVKVIPGISSDTFYAHNDHLGTLRAESDEMAAFNTYPVHTAFGEDITDKQFLCAFALKAYQGDMYWSLSKFLLLFLIA